MLARIVILLLLLHAPVAMAAPYYEGTMRVTFRDTARGRDIPVTIIYPAEGASGTDKPLVGTSTNSVPTFKVVVMGHGYQMPVSAYASFATNICRTFGDHIVVLPETGAGLFPSHGEFAADMVSCLHYMQREHKRQGSVWYGHVANANIIAGHSMGGGAAFLAAKDVLKNTSLTLSALIALAPAETNPSSKSAAVAVNVPTLILAGGNDCVTPLAGTVQPIYDSLPGPCKVLALIPGASHCQFADANATCSLGELNCRATITRTAQFDRCWAYINALLRGTDSVALRIGDTDVQTSMVMFKGDELMADATEVCYGDTVHLRSRVDTGHLLWLPGNVKGATYNVVLRDTAMRITLVNTQCFSESRLYVTIRRRPDPTLTMETPGGICPEGSLMLHARATDAARIEWSTGETGDSIRITSPGTYRATAVSQYGCRSVTDSVLVRPITLPLIPIDRHGDTMLCNGVGGVKLTPSFDKERYDRVLWSNGASGTSLTIARPGTYTISARILPRDESDCIMRTDTVRLTIRDINAPVPTLTYRRDTLWSTPGRSYAWSVDGEPITGWNAQYHVPTRTGRYRVVVAYDDAGTCTATSEGLLVTPGTSVSTGPSNGVALDVAGGRIHVRGVPAHARVRLVSSQGAVCIDQTANAVGDAVLMAPLASGIYFVMVGTSDVYPIGYISGR